MSNDPVKEAEYINRLSLTLEKFQWIRNNELANCRCPICGDSDRDRNKARGYFLFDRDKGRFGYYCHNCHTSMPLTFMLKEYYPELFSEFVFDRFRDAKPAKNTESDVRTKVSEKPRFKQQADTIEKVLEYCEPVSELSSKHPAVQYLTKRMIPLDDLWYAESFRDAVDTFDHDYDIDRFPNDKRIVIPFRDKSGRAYAFQGRSLNPKTKLRYITIKENDDDLLVFGLDTVDTSKPTIVVEGPFDSKMLPNSIAMVGSSMHRVDKLFKPNEIDNMIFVWDNEPKNRYIVRKMERFMTEGKKVCVWDKKTPGDINAMILSGMSMTSILKLIKRSTVTGLAGSLQLVRYKQQV